MGRSLLATPTLDLAAIAGYRAYFGMDRWKTFFDLDLIAFARPTWGLGPRIGFGVQYELTSILGVFASAAAQLGYGNAFRIDVDALIGLQLRSYLLE